MTQTLFGQSARIRSMNFIKFCLLTFNHLSPSRHQAVICHGHIPSPALSLACCCPASVNAHFPVGSLLRDWRAPGGRWQRAGALLLLASESIPMAPVSPVFQKREHFSGRLGSRGAPPYGRSGWASRLWEQQGQAPRVEKPVRGMGTGAPDAPVLNYFF